MANPRGNPQNLRKFVKGQPTANPAGRPKDLFSASLKKLTSEELGDLANVIVKGNIEQLRAVAKDKNAPVIKVMVASVAVKIIERGDIHALDVLLNRLLGKVRDRVEHIGIPAPEAVRIIIGLPDNGRSAKE